MFWFKDMDTQKDTNKYLKGLQNKMLHTRLILKSLFLQREDFDTNIIYILYY